MADNVVLGVVWRCDLFGIIIDPTDILPAVW